MAGDNRVSGSMMWPGADQTYKGISAFYIERWNRHVPYNKRVDKVTYNYFKKWLHFNLKLKLDIPSPKAAVVISNFNRLICYMFKTILNQSFICIRMKLVGIISGFILDYRR